MRKQARTKVFSSLVAGELSPGLNDLATYNVKDFTDVCLRNKIEMVC